MRAKKITVIAMLAAVSIAGRIALMAIPQVKPVIAIVIISGSCVGPGSGFLVGAISMFTSNMILGQGIWTVWQMIAAGMMGVIFGMLPVKKRLSISVLGGIATVLIYGGIMNVSSIFMFQKSPTLGAIALYCLYGLPFDIIHGAATFAFLWVFYDRAKVLVEKYLGT